MNFTREDLKAALFLVCSSEAPLGDHVILDQINTTIAEKIDRLYDEAYKNELVINPHGSFCVGMEEINKAIRDDDDGC